MTTKKTIYFSHPMEHGGKLIDGCGKRAFEMREKIGDKFNFWIPEENQTPSKDTQQQVDLDALKRADIIVVDLYHFGMVINDEAILGMGTNQEVGFVKCMNVTRTKQVPIVQIVRSPKHPFMVETGDYGVTKNCTSLDEACEYLVKNYANK